MKTRWIATTCLAVAAGFAHAGSSAPFELKASLAFSTNPDQFLLVYSSNEIDSGPNIYGRLLNTVGAPLDRDFRLSTLTGKMSKPVVAYDARDRKFLVAWGRKELGGKAEIIGLNVGIDGKVIGQEFQISVSNLYDERPAIAYCPGRDRFLVTWERGTHYDFEKGVSDVYGQFVAGDGSGLIGSNFAIAAADKNQFKVDVACDVLNDHFLIVWEDQRNLATQDDIYGQLMSSDGTMIGGNYLIAGTSTIERRPVVAANTRDGGFLVAWESDTGVKTDLFSQLLDSNGQPLGRPVSFGSDLAGTRDRPAVAYLQQQNVFLTVFHNADDAGLADGIFGQFFEHTGELRETDFPVTTAKLGQNRPDVEPARDSFLTVWTDYRDTADPDAKRHVYEYYGRVIGNDMALSSRWRNPESQ